MRRTVSLVLGLAIVLPGPAAPVVAQGQADRERGTGYCRRPDALPQLPAETQRTRRNGDRPAGGESASLSRLPSAPPPPPPPPPPSPASRDAEADDGSDAIMVTGTRVARPDLESRSPVVTVDESSLSAEDSAEEAAVAGSRRRPPSQSGLLTAGEHDDLLNPELYADYVRRSDLGQTIRGLPRVDTGRLLTVEVRDSRGRAVPFALVEVRCSDGNSLTLRTMADGRAVFFPDLDRLSPQVEVRAGGEWRRADLARARGSTEIGFTVGAAPAVGKLDLALVVDVTGSMADELSYLQAELKSILASIEQRHPELDIRVGFSFYRDQGDEFVTDTAPLSGDIDAGQALLASHRADGGGDYEEAMQEALVRAAGFAWRDDAVKTLLLVGDAPPHDEDFPLAWLAAEHLRSDRVHIVPVGASGVADKSEFLMRAMAASTQSRYVFLTDDSGIGNRHAAPAIDCYLVTRLDALLRRIIDSQLSGRRVEPADSEVIREVGKYDAGRCVLPRDFGRDRRQ